MSVAFKEVCLQQTYNCPVQDCSLHSAFPKTVPSSISWQNNLERFIVCYSSSSVAPLPTYTTAISVPIYVQLVLNNL